jgi:hypothetical protein
MALFYYIGLAVIAIAFLSSLVSFGLDYASHLKLFSFILGCTVLNELGAFVIPKYFHGSNVPWYNILMGIEFWLYAFYFGKILHRRWIQQVIKSFLFGFPIFWLIVVFWVFGIKSWNSYVAIAGSLFTVFLAVMFCYQLFTQRELVRLTVSSEFWIAVGLFIFYSCNLPYIGMLNYLVKNYLILAQKLLIVLQILNIAMYSTFTYAFLCRIRTAKL